MLQRIEKLGQMPNPSFYRRADGTTWTKLNERFHVLAKIEDGHIVGAGSAEEFDPREIVEVLIKGHEDEYVQPKRKTPPATR